LTNQFYGIIKLARGLSWLELKSSGLLFVARLSSGRQRSIRLREIIKQDMPIQISRLPSPEDWREKQLGTLKAVGEGNYRKKIAKPKKSPIAAGIAAEDKYAEAMRKALDARARAAGLKAVTDDEWLTYATEIGAGRLVEGVVKREPKVKKFIDAFQPMLAEHLTKIDPMPNVTLSDRKAKMLANVDGLVALHGAAKRKVG